ncbi:MAG: helix-turn-helix domain-containing protein [Planctomycetota bacterium]|jgi:excisionase family DNA binding protein
MLKISEVAKILAITEWKVNQLLKAGKLRGHQLNKEWRVTQEQIDEYLESTLNTRDTDAAKD